MVAESILIEPHYLPSIAVFKHLYAASTIYLSVQGAYKRQSYRNRTYILTSQGLQPLIVPILKSSTKGAYAKVAIDYSRPWYRAHLRALEVTYHQAPYYDALQSLLVPIFLAKPTYLVDFNRQLLQACFGLLPLARSIVCTTNAEAATERRDRLDARDAFSPKGPPSTLACNTSLPGYAPRFSSMCSPKLSIVDLLCMQGPYAHRVLASPEGSPLQSLGSAE